MLVYGDPWREIDLAEWRERAAAPLPAGAWIEAHAERVARLIEAGQILQALEDVRFDANGARDQGDKSLEPLRLHLVALARGVGASWNSRGVSPPAPAPPALPPSPPLRAREPEGYAFYALYPEASFLAAQQARAQRGVDLVLGLRSIGASLAPMVCAGLGLHGFATLRPSGQAFDRVIEAPDLAAHLRGSQPHCVAIVDEGPGLSGSSFAATARFVREHAPQSDVHLFPSHRWGPGPQAAEETRQLFRTAPQTIVDFDQLAPPRHLARWFEDLIGPLLAPPEDLSGGAWRSRHYRSEAEWPAVDCMQERRKFLLRTELGNFLLKFTGLGRLGESKAAVARALSQARLAPDVLAFRHGFLLERWREEARPLDARTDRALLIPAIARYLAFRKDRFPAPRAYGASLSELREMTRRNVSLALGEAAGAQVDRVLRGLPDWEGSLQRIATDNRMHVHEWLMADGLLLKSDGADHHAAHDLVGAQDVIWDIAGAIMAFELTGDEAKRLCDQIEAATKQTVVRPLLAPMRLVWLAFETGRLNLALQALAGSKEEPRLRVRIAAMTDSLRRELEQIQSSTAWELQSHTLVWPT